MQETVGRLDIRSLGDCTLREITEQWNTGFALYFGGDMTKSIMEMSSRIGRMNIHPELSVMGYIDGMPAGFVMIGLVQANGRKLAWNGGTGVNPAFRGMSLSKRLLQEAIDRTQAAGAHRITLETRTENERAIRSYASCGFRIIDTVHNMRKEGEFAGMPFQRRTGASYRAVQATPRQVGRLAFYPLSQNSWTTEWFSTESSEAIIALDTAGEPAGYAIYSKILNLHGHAENVLLMQCEADSRRSDSEEVVRYLLNEVFAPQSPIAMRRTHYLRAKNTAALDALREAGFETVITEHTMAMEF
jgi:ribosomal protein S18 acetylase RimI-like enzyme